MKAASKQNGFLAILAVILVVIVGLIGTTISYLAVHHSQSTVTAGDSATALYVADGGLDMAAHALEAGTACNSLSGSADFTNKSLGDGTFTLTGAAYTPSPTTLTTSITTTSTVIPVTSITGYAPDGRVIIDGEMIGYTGTSTDPLTCGTEPCFTGATRGLSNSLLAAHSSGATVIQSQCNLTSTGGYPNLSSPIAERQITEQDYNLPTSAGTVWAVGNTQGSSETILQWNGFYWVKQPDYASVPDAHLNGISMVSKTDIWAVGAKDSGTANFIYWNGITWDRVLPDASVPNVSIYGIQCLASNDCWAVGAKSNGYPHIDHYNGTSWVRSTTTGLPNVDLNGIFCVNANDCWAVGGSKTFLHYDGVSWSDVVPDGSVANQTINSVFCTAANNCWAVGNSKTYAHYDGSTWSSDDASWLDGTVPNSHVLGVACDSANDCWAVGDATAGAGLFVHWDGTVWTRVLTPSISDGLVGISCNSSTDCWIAGKGSTIGHWAGSNWTLSPVDPAIGNIQINAISSVIPGSGGDVIRGMWRADT